MDRNTNRFAETLLRLGRKFDAGLKRNCEQRATIGADVHGNPRSNTGSCAEMRPHFSSNSTALHPPELNWHLTKSRLNDAPPLCEMQRRNICLARLREEQVCTSWARVD